MIKGMNHVGLSVTNLEQSVAFYREAFGMEEVIQAPFSGKPYESVLGLSGASGRAALLECKGTGLQLELFEFAHPAPKRADQDRPVCDHGITHFCIEVLGIEAEYERLLAIGARFHCPPKTFKPSGNKATYGRDPDGNVFELWERSPSRT